MRKRTQWILLSIIILLIVLIGLYRFYLYIHEDAWNAERAAVQQAKQETDLVRSDEVWKSVWDKVCYVIQGQDEAGREIMVWLPEGGKPEVRLLSEGKSEDQIRGIIKETLPEIEVVRLLPGIYNDQLVWQLFYKQQAHHYYRFFSFSTGEPLQEVFTLPNR